MMRAPLPYKLLIIIKKIVFFEFLGIEGIIFQMKNDPLQKFIKKKLGNLIEEDKKKDMD